MIILSKEEVKKMENNILDKETGMTEMDLFEYNHCYEDWRIF